LEEVAFSFPQPGFSFSLPAFILVQGQRLKNGHAEAFLMAKFNLGTRRVRRPHFRRTKTLTFKIDSRQGSCQKTGKNSHLSFKFAFCNCAFWPIFCRASFYFSHTLSTPS
jgi:hypothetical protein